MAEKVTLTVAETKPENTAYEVERLTFDIKAKTIHVQLLGDNGEALSKVYDSTTTPTGASLLTTVNTSDNRTVSLIKKVYNRLIADGILVGTVSGTPD